MLTPSEAHARSPLPLIARDAERLRRFAGECVFQLVRPARIIKKVSGHEGQIDIPAFAEGKLIPTSENLAWWIAAEMQDALGRSTRVLRVRVAEEPGLWAEIEPE